MKRFFLITAMCLIGTLLLPLAADAQGTSDSGKDRPKWATPTYHHDLTNTYLEVVVITGHEGKSNVRREAQKEIERRRKSWVGENDPWIKSGPIAEWWTSDGFTGYFLYQTRKNPTWEPEGVESTTHYGFSGWVFLPGAQQIRKGQPGRAALFIGGEVLCIGGIVLSQTLKANYISKMNGTHNNSQKKLYANQANVWNGLGYGFIAGAAVFYVWNIIDGIVAPGRPTIKLKDNDKILAFEPAVAPQYAGLSLSLTF